MRRTSGLLALAALVSAGVSCGDVVRDSRAPVLLVMNSLQGAKGSAPAAFSVPLLSDVITNVTAPAPCTAQTPCPTIFNDLGQAVFAVTMKDVTVTPSSNNQVTITRYHVDYARSDGRNQQGVDVPYSFDGAATLTIQANATGTLGFELVQSLAKQQTPLVQLVTNPVEIITIATVTFYGADIVGNAVQVSGTITVDFANFGDQ
jgi:hypothetical protein